MLRDIQAHEFDAVIRGEWVLVGFLASWCGPCQRTRPALESCGRDGSLTHVAFCALDADAAGARQVFRAEGVRSMPALVLYRLGEEIGRRVGAAASHLELLRWITEHVRTAYEVITVPDPVEADPMTLDGLRAMVLDGIDRLLRRPILTTPVQRRVLRSQRILYERGDAVCAEHLAIYQSIQRGEVHDESDDPADTEPREPGPADDDGDPG